MAVLRPQDQLPGLNAATILLPARGSQNPGNRGCLRSVLRSPCPPEGLLCPGINRQPYLSGQLVGTEDALLQRLADSMLKEDCASDLKVHLAQSLPLPSNVTRPRIDLIVFVVNLHSKYSLQNVEESLHHVDAAFFLGKLGGTVTAASTGTLCYAWPKPTGAPCSSVTWRWKAFESPWPSAWSACCRSVLATCPACQP
ncbi:centromere protein M isoform X2 [Desmodus rotundus]|uniref:centromere protein M isoform X2 n=1 Tax=Desmodus rotundus TaxID=9430 RepID=UPI002380D88B|nr:centromere protein M isoform X2 [Desmodus rotundus]